MGIRVMSCKLNYLGASLYSISKIDPDFRAQMDRIPEGTQIVYNFPFLNSTSSLSFKKQNYAFLPLQEETSTSICFQIQTKKTAQKLFSGNINLARAIANHDITVSGPSSTTLAIIQVVQLSFPYVFGIKKTQTLVPFQVLPRNFRQKRIKYCFLRLLPKRKRSAIEKTN